jgi:hypothetical protein
VLDIAMTKIRLQGACVMAGVGEGEAAGLPEHVGMGLGLHAGAAGRFRHDGRLQRRL